MGNTFPTLMAFSNLSIHFISLFVKREKNEIYQKNPKAHVKFHIVEQDIWFIVFELLYQVDS